MTLLSLFITATGLRTQAGKKQPIKVNLRCRRRRLYVLISHPNSHLSRLAHETRTVASTPYLRRSSATPDLPFPFHHASTVVVPAGVCKKSDPQRVVIWSGRDGNSHGPTHNAYFELRLATPPKGEEWTWIVHVGAPSLTSSAAQALSPDGRYAIVFAGNGFTRKTNFFRLKSTFVFDLCEPKRVCRATESSLRYRKWALTGCTTPSGKEFIICGGDSPNEDDRSKDREGNTNSCDIFDLGKLVQECHSARPGRGKGFKETFEAWTRLGL